MGGFVWGLKTTGALCLFSVVGLFATTIWFFSSLYPIISQPKYLSIGKDPTLGGPLLSQTSYDEIMAKIGVSHDASGAIVGFDVDTGIAILDVSDLGIGEVISNFTYAEANDLANELNGACVENGACEIISNRQEANFGNVGSGENSNVSSFCLFLLNTLASFQVSKLTSSSLSNSINAPRLPIPQRITCLRFLGFWKASARQIISRSRPFSSTVSF